MRLVLSLLLLGALGASSSAQACDTLTNCVELKKFGVSAGAGSVRIEFAAADILAGTLPAGCGVNPTYSFAPADTTLIDRLMTMGLYVMATPSARLSLQVRSTSLLCVIDAASVSMDP